MRFKRPNSKLYPNVHPVLQRLRELRIETNQTQIQIADILGYSTMEISHIERHTRNIPFQRIVDYAEYLGYDIVLVPKGPSQ